MNIFCITLTNNEKKYPQISCLSLYDQQTLSMARKNLPGNNCHRTNAPAGYSTLLHRATGSKTSPCFMSGSCSGLMLSRSIVRSCGWEFLLFYTTHTHTNHPLPLTPFIRKLNAEENTQTSPHGQTPYANICWKEKTWQPNLYVSSFYLFLSVILDCILFVFVNRRHHFLHHSDAFVILLWAAYTDYPCRISVLVLT